MSGDRVLVAYGSKHGSTTEIAEEVAHVLRGMGFSVDLQSIDRTVDLVPHRAVIVGSAIYAGRWRKDARRFLRRHAAELAAIDVWLFSSGPLDRTAETSDVDPPHEVLELTADLQVHGHVTFGGRLEAGTPGLVEGLMTRHGAPGDFRNFDRVRVWAHRVGEALQGQPVGVLP